MEYGLSGLTDISAHLCEPEFNGATSPPDVQRVISRAWDSGLEKIFIPGRCYKTSKRALRIARTDKRLYCTVGYHPSNYYLFKRKGASLVDHLAGLIEYSKKKCSAVGIFGLDFTDEGLAMCEKQDQLKFFDWHVQLGHILRRPLMFYFRGDAFEDMVPKLTQERDHGMVRGVCHSFQGSLGQAQELVRKGFYIGFDGCSLREKKDLEVMKRVPLNRLLLGTSSPHCSVLRPHAALRHLTTAFFPKKNQRFYNEMVFGRTEPSHLCHLIEIVASVRSMELQELAEILQMNIKKLFFTKPRLVVNCDCTSMQ